MHELHECLSKALTWLEEQAARVRSSSARHTKQSTMLSMTTSAHRAPSNSVDARPATNAIHFKYVELDRSLNAYPSYKPLSLTFYEPANSADRYRWLHDMKLSFPIALLKVAIGGPIGTLIWIVKRDVDMMEIGDEEEIQDALSAIQPLIPQAMSSLLPVVWTPQIRAMFFELVTFFAQVHTRALKKNYSSKLSDLISLPKSVVRFLYKELTGDESEECNISTKERQAAVDARFALAETFAFACGEAEIIGDFRSITSATAKGKTCFEEFWRCVTEELDAMTVAADDRRHSGVVAYLSEVVSHATLFARAQARFDSKVASGEIAAGTKVPSQKWFAFQFWPTNEHVRTALQYSGRFPLKLQLQVRNLRKDHAHLYYCAKQKKLVEEWIFKYREYSSAGQPDDKANGTIGEPGTATTFLSRQRCALSSTNCSAQDGMRAMDHDAGSSKIRLIPSVFLKQEIPETLDGSWLRGQVFVTLKNNVFEASEANKSLAEIEKCLYDCNPNVWLHSDGGGEHHVGHPSVIAAAICMFRRLHHRMDRLIKTRGCPYHSYLHEVERVMSILNLGLYGVALERPLIDQQKYPGMEHLFTTSKSVSDLRAAGKRFPQLMHGLEAALQPVNDLLYNRFEQLQLKGVPFSRGEKASREEADAFFDCIKVVSSQCCVVPHAHRATYSN